MLRAYCDVRAHVVTGELVAAAPAAQHPRPRLRPEARISLALRAPGSIAGALRGCRRFGVCGRLRGPARVESSLGDLKRTSSRQCARGARAFTRTERAGAGSYSDVVPN
jgi:hypothetical protein